MKKLLINLINKIEMNRIKHPKTFKLVMILLWVIAPLEMACIKLGIFGYTKINQYNNKKELT